jgi:hypothetical protein
MNICKMHTVVEITDRPPISYTTELSSEGPTINETLHSLLKGHISILQNELETLEKVIK